MFEVDITSIILTLQRLGGAGWVQSTPLLIYLSSHEKHFYIGPDAPGLLIKFIWARINHAAKTF